MSHRDWASRLPTGLDKGLRHPRVGYVVKMFPRLSETFIVNEILELERQGVPIDIFSLLEPTEEVRHEALKRVQAPITYLPQESVLRQLTLREARFSEGTSSERPIEELFPEMARLEASFLALKAAALTAVARLKGVEHLHAHFGTDATTVAMLASGLAGIPYSFTAHAKDIYHRYAEPTLLAGKIRRAQFVITVSEYNRRHLAGVAGPDLAGKIFRLYNGIDLDRFRPRSRVNREPNLILAVGRLVEKKGFQHLVDACRFLLDWERPVRCLIVGKGPDHAALAQRINALGLHDRVSLLGAVPQEQLLEILQRATVLVHPCVVSATGDREGLPTVLLEALAVGLPAISTTVAGIPEIIEHGQTGLLVPPGHPLLLAKAIQELLANPELQDHFGRQGRSKAEKMFDIRKNAVVLRDRFVQSVTREKTLLELAPDEDRVPLGR